MAGTMSVPRSMQRIVIVPSGSGMLQMMNRRNGEISGMLLVNVYAIDFLRLSNISLPGNGKETRIHGTPIGIHLHTRNCSCYSIVRHSIYITGWFRYSTLHYLLQLQWRLMQSCRLARSCRRLAYWHPIQRCPWQHLNIDHTIKTQILWSDQQKILQLSRSVDWNIIKNRVEKVPTAQHWSRRLASD